jgi:hypothetical protein
MLPLGTLLCKMDGNIKIDLLKEVKVKLCIVSGYKRNEFVAFVSGVLYI